MGVIADFTRPVMKPDSIPKGSIMVKNLATIAAWLIAGPRVAVQTRSLLTNLDRNFGRRETVLVHQPDGSTITLIVPRNTGT